jgi:hypothetical protein
MKWGLTEHVGHRLATALCQVVAQCLQLARYLLLRCECLLQCCQRALCASDCFNAVTCAYV